MEKTAGGRGLGWKVIAKDRLAVGEGEGQQLGRLVGLVSGVSQTIVEHPEAILAVDPNTENAVEDLGTRAKGPVPGQVRPGPVAIGPGDLDELRLGAAELVNRGEDAPRLGDREIARVDGQLRHRLDGAREQLLPGPGRQGGEQGQDQQEGGKGGTHGFLLD